MSQPADQVAPPASTADLRAALEQALADHFARPCRIIRLERRPSLYRTSYPLEELDVRLEDGTALTLMFKDLNRQRLSPEARQVKPAFVYDPLRELETYRLILAPSGLGTATCYGTVVDAAAGRYWLFLEKVAGVELYQVGDFALWRQAARWFAGLHSRFAGDVGLAALADAVHLLTHTRDYYRLWMRRALEFANTATGFPPVGKRPSLDWLASRYDQVVERLAALPVTVIHGEFYASNVLVQTLGEGVRVCPVDWEMAGLAPGLIDLAALTAGVWTEEERTALALEYHAALGPLEDGPLGPDAFLAALDCCRLHLAVQWLGWSPNWSPPAEHAWDWWGEALHLAEKLGL
jgi:hypothetical protein